MVQVSMLSDNDTLPMSFILWSTSTTKDLEDIEDSQANKITLFLTINLSSLNDDGVGGQVDTPSQCGGTTEHSNVTLAEQILHQRPIRSEHTGMMHSHSTIDQVYQVTIP